jgi:general secretion pathway protein L
MVSRVLSFSPIRWVSSVRDLLARLGQWWVIEFLALFPERLSEWLTDRGYKKLTLAAEADSFVLLLSSDRHRPLASARIARDVYSPTAVDDFLKARELGRGQVVIGVRLPRDQVFCRQIALPFEAAGSIHEIVVQDLVTKTPFRLSDIYHDHRSRTVGDKVVVWQWIVRREFVTSAVQSAGLDPADVAFVDSVDNGGGAPAPMLTLRQDRTGRHSWLRKTFYALAFGASFLAVVSCTHKYWRQQRILDNLSAELTTARANAQQVRATMDKLDQKQAAIVHVRSQKRDGSGLLDVWEEVSRILPLDSWLTELRLSEVGQKQDQQLVVITGLSTAAADLVALVDKSSLFTDAALTAPIALDSIEQRERFTLQAKLRQKRQIEKPAP